MRKTLTLGDGPAGFTPETLVACDARLYVNCTACRVLRPLDLHALCAAGRDRQRLAEMMFRCTTCARLGRSTETWPLVCWWAKGVDYTYDYASEELRTG